MKDMTNENMTTSTKLQQGFSRDEQKMIDSRLNQLPRSLQRMIIKKSSNIRPKEAFLIFSGFAEMLVLYKKHVFSEDYAYNQLVFDYWKTISHYNNSVRNNFLMYQSRALEYLANLESSPEALFMLKDCMYVMKKADLADKISAKNVEHYFAVLNALEYKFKEVYSNIQQTGRHDEALQKVDWVKSVALRSSPDDIKNHAKFDELLLDIVKNKKLIVEIYATLTADQKCRLGKALFEEYELIADEEREFIRVSEHYSYELIQYVYTSKRCLFQLYINESRHEISQITLYLSEIIGDILMVGLSKSEPSYLRQYLIEDKTRDNMLSITILSNPFFYQKLFLKISPTQVEPIVTTLCQNPIFRQAVLEVDTEISLWFCSTKKAEFQEVKAFTDLQNLITAKNSFYQTRLSL